MQPEFPSDQTEQAGQHERRNRVTALCSRFQFLHHAEQKPQAGKVQVIGNATEVIGRDAPEIISRSMRDYYGYEGDITIITKRLDPESPDR